MPIKYGSSQKYFFKKSLGQNILTDKNIAGKIISFLNIKEDDVILEIGPGLGALTDILSEYDNEIIAIEKDNRFAEKLKVRYSRPNVHIINGDALRFDYGELYKKYNKKLKVVANLPYNISTQIVFLLLENNKFFKGLLFMFQKEVAQRIAASPSTKDYGILSVISQYYSSPKIVMTVPAGCFTPKPKVESAVVYFDIYESPPFFTRDKELFKKIVKTAFSHRRKTLSNCFKGFTYKDISDFDIAKIFDSANIDLGRRGETLSLKEFVNLAEKFYDMISRGIE